MTKNAKYTSTRNRTLSIALAAVFALVGALGMACNTQTAMSDDVVEEQPATPPVIEQDPQQGSDNLPTVNETHFGEFSIDDVSFKGIGSYFESEFLEPAFGSLGLSFDDLNDYTRQLLADELASEVTTSFVTSREELASSSDADFMFNPSDLGTLFDSLVQLCIGDEVISVGDSDIDISRNQALIIVDALIRDMLNWVNDDLRPSNGADALHSQNYTARDFAFRGLDQSLRSIFADEGVDIESLNQSQIEAYRANLRAPFEGAISTLFWYSDIEFAFLQSVAGRLSVAFSLPETIGFTVLIRGENAGTDSEVLRQLNRTSAIAYLRAFTDAVDDWFDSL